MKASPLSLCLAAALVCVAISGCTDVSSSDLKTSGIDAYFTVIASGTGGTTANAELSVDGSTLTYVELKTGDNLSATVGDQLKFLQESKAFGIISYDATFAGADAEGTVYTFSLDRQNDTSAPNSSATLPAPFSLTAPSGAALTYSRANDDIAVGYDNAGLADPISYTLDGDCINPVTQAVSGDPGAFTIPKTTMTQLNGAGTTCTVTLTVLRSRPGTLDSAFAGGSTAGIQARSVTFTSTP